jgi:hypothetical protein
MPKVRQMPNLSTAAAVGIRVDSTSYTWHLACLGREHEVRKVTLRIEEISDGQHTVLRLSGRIQSEHLEELMAHIRRHRPAIVLDLEDVALVDVSAVRFLSSCEAEGIELLHCAPYIRKWMDRERGREE